MSIENNDNLQTSNSADPRGNPNFKKKKKKDVEDFFKLFFESPELSSIEETQAEIDSTEQKIDKYITAMKYSDSTPYICNYIFENLNNIWSCDFGLNNPYSSYNFEELYKKAPDLYHSIDILCSVIYKIRNLDDRLGTVDNNLSVQKGNLESKINNQKGNLESKINNQKDNLESKINNQKDNILSDIKSLIYPEIITILGIFTAITFAIFGGMNLLTDLFQNIGSSPASLGQILILAAIFGLIMWGIIELLFYWISKIKGITNSTKDKNKTYFNWLAIGVLAIILILGILLFTKVIK